MFVTRSKYDSLMAEHADLTIRHVRIKMRWNDLIEKLNKRGGEAFLEHKCQQLSNDDIRTLVRFCHPDKHGGNRDAESITAKLLQLRDK